MVYLRSRARTLTEAFNVVYETAQTRPGWKRSTLTVAFGPVFALMVIVSVGLMLIGSRLVERIAELVGLDKMLVYLWGGYAPPWPYSFSPWYLHSSTDTFPTPRSAFG